MIQIYYFYYNRICNRSIISRLLIWICLSAPIATNLNYSTSFSSRPQFAIRNRIQTFECETTNRNVYNKTRRNNAHSRKEVEAKSKKAKQRSRAERRQRCSRATAALLSDKNAAKKKKLKSVGGVLDTKASQSPST